MKQKTQHAALKGGLMMATAEYHPTDKERAADANYEASARAYVALRGADPDEVVALQPDRAPGNGKPLVGIRMTRWQVAVRELIPFDLKLLALMAGMPERAKLAAERIEQIKAEAATADAPSSPS